MTYREGIHTPLALFSRISEIQSCSYKHAFLSIAYRQTYNRLHDIGMENLTVHGNGLHLFFKPRHSIYSDYFFLAPDIAAVGNPFNAVLADNRTYYLLSVTVAGFEFMVHYRIRFQWIISVPEGLGAGPEHVALRTGSVG